MKPQLPSKTAAANISRLVPTPETACMRSKYSIR
jgi:hypothetical protein